MPDRLRNNRTRNVICRITFYRIRWRFRDMSRSRIINLVRELWEIGVEEGVTSCSAEYELGNKR